MKKISSRVSPVSEYPTARLRNATISGRPGNTSFRNFSQRSHLASGTQYTGVAFVSISSLRLVRNSQLRSPVVLTPLKNNQPAGIALTSQVPTHNRGSATGTDGNVVGIGG